MNKLITFLFAFLLTTPAWADSTINALSAGTALGGTEQIPMFQTANPAVTTTPNALKTFIGGGTVTSISSGCGSSTGGSAITTSGTISSVETVNLQTGANYAIVNGDCGKLVDLSNGSAQTPTIAQAGSGGNFTSGWYADVCNIGAGTQTLTPATSTINAAATLTLIKGQCYRVVSDGTNYQVSGTGLFGTTGSGNLVYGTSPTFDGGTVTASNPILNLIQTWNNAAVQFTGIKLNATVTASNNFGLLIDLQRAGVSKFSVDEFGNGSIANGLTVPLGARVDQSNGVSVSGTLKLGFSPSTNVAVAQDTAFCRNAAGVMEINNGTCGTFREAKLRSLVVGGTVPALTGTCTTASQTGGATAGTFAATCTAQTVIITFAFTAPTGWSCNAHDLSTPADALNQTASSTTTATLTGTTVASDTISFNCMAY